MRDFGLPQVLTWRWTPCVALALGSLTFAGLATLLIPERIGAFNTEAHGAAVPVLGADLVSTQLGAATPARGWSGPAEAEQPTQSTAAARIASRPPDPFPKRGFSPPLERAEPPPATPPPAPPPVEAPPAAAPPPANPTPAAEPPAQPAGVSAPTTEAAPPPTAPQ